MLCLALEQILEIRERVTNTLTWSLLVQISGYRKSVSFRKPIVCLTSNGLSTLMIEKHLSLNEYIAKERKR